MKFISTPVPSVSHIAPEMERLLEVKVEGVIERDALFALATIDPSATCVGFPLAGDGVEGQSSVADSATAIACGKVSER